MLMLRGFVQFSKRTQAPAWRQLAPDPCTSPFVLTAVLLLCVTHCSWGLPVEAALGFKLDAFIVHSMADSHLLRQLIGRCFQGAWQ